MEDRPAPDYTEPSQEYIEEFEDELGQLLEEYGINIDNIIEIYNTDYIKPIRFNDHRTLNLWFTNGVLATYPDDEPLGFLRENTEPRREERGTLDIKNYYDDAKRYTTYDYGSHEHSGIAWYDAAKTMFSDSDDDLTTINTVQSIRIKEHISYLPLSHYHKASDLLDVYANSIINFIFLDHFEARKNFILSLNFDEDIYEIFSVAIAHSLATVMIILVPKINVYLTAMGHEIKEADQFLKKTSRYSLDVLYYYIYRPIIEKLSHDEENKIEPWMIFFLEAATLSSPELIFGDYGVQENLTIRNQGDHSILYMIKLCTDYLDNRAGSADDFQMKIFNRGQYYITVPTETDERVAALLRDLMNPIFNATLVLVEDNKRNLVARYTSFKPSDFTRPTIEEIIAYEAQTGNTCIYIPTTEEYFQSFVSQYQEHEIDETTESSFPTEKRETPLIYHLIRHLKTKKAFDAQLKKTSEENIKEMDTEFTVKYEIMNFTKKNEIMTTTMLRNNEENSYRKLDCKHMIKNDKNPTSKISSLIYKMILIETLYDYNVTPSQEETDLIAYIKDNATKENTEQNEDNDKRFELLMERSTKLVKRVMRHRYRESFFDNQVHGSLTVLSIDLPTINTPFKSIGMKIFNITLSNTTESLFCTIRTTTRYFSKGTPDTQTKNDKSNTINLMHSSSRTIRETWYYNFLHPTVYENIKEQNYNTIMLLYINNKRYISTTAERVLHRGTESALRDKDKICKDLTNAIKLSGYFALKNITTTELKFEDFSFYYEKSICEITKCKLIYKQLSFTITHIIYNCVMRSQMAKDFRNNRMQGTSQLINTYFRSGFPYITDQRKTDTNGKRTEEKYTIDFPKKVPNLIFTDILPRSLDPTSDAVEPPPPTLIPPPLWRPPYEQSR
jgi:hypothetical protein